MSMIFVAATLYAVGKSFFWPTMLGVVAEQCQSLRAGVWIADPRA
jgi:hypothetical protein